MIGMPYWDNRLHRWGAWLATDRGRLSSTPLAKMRALGVRVQANAEAELPMVHEAERETDAMVHALPVRAAAILDAHYRRQDSVNQLAVLWKLHPDTIRSHIRDCHKRLQRMLDERRRGEPKRPQPKAVTVHGSGERGRGRTLASVVPD